MLHALKLFEPLLSPLLAFLLIGILLLALHRGWIYSETLDVIVRWFAKRKHQKRCSKCRGIGSIYSGDPEGRWSLCPKCHGASLFYRDDEIGAKD